RVGYSWVKLRDRVMPMYRKWLHIVTKTKLECQVWSHAPRILNVEPEHMHARRLVFGTLGGGIVDSTQQKAGIRIASLTQQLPWESSLGSEKRKLGIVFDWEIRSPLVIYPSKLDQVFA